MMLVCTCCGVEKEVGCFYIRNDTGRPKKKCKVCCAEVVKRWKSKNQDKVRSYIRKSCKKAYDLNPEKYKLKQRVKRANNPIKSREIVNKSYKKVYQSRREQERARLNALNASRRAASPKWLTAIQKAMIQEFYDVAKAKSVQTGTKYHVDHIIPINGKEVCGLHVPWNLQLLTEAENCGKSNKVVGR